MGFPLTLTIPPEIMKKLQADGVDITNLKEIRAYLTKHLEKTLPNGAGSKNE